MSVAWKPLESNPEAFNQLIHSLGVPKNFEFVDVFGLDDDSLAFVQQPCLALIFLYPLDPLDRSSLEYKDNSDVHFIKQTISNACGTIAVLHSILNNTDVIDLLNESPLKHYFKESKSLNPLERGKLLESNQAIASSHLSTAKSGQTEVMGEESNTNLHFVAFVEKNKTIYELDGRKKAPIQHKNTKQNFLKGCACIFQEWIRRGNSTEFSVIALTVKN